MREMEMREIEMREIEMREIEMREIGMREIEMREIGMREKRTEDADRKTSRFALSHSSLKTDQIHHSLHCGIM